VPKSFTGISLAFNALRRFALKHLPYSTDTDQNRMIWCVASEKENFAALAGVFPLMLFSLNGKIIVPADSP